MHLKEIKDEELAERLLKEFNNLDLLIRAQNMLEAPRNLRLVPQ
jgi:hypothetical protein